ncbi:MAG: glutamate-cysteine ligase family protein, partial [Planctomycetota bacterium]|nr:glutamate-cysteine ligase family protein [Planctomycetota bacterium]
PQRWSNELALHVIELKTIEPVAELAPVVDLFQHDVRRINSILEPMGARLLPTATHPWMNPHTELKLWPHEYNAVYESFHRIFDCTGHGWANLQSTHINLPFANDDEFARLHAAIRVILPILPALAASSPIMDAAVTGMADTRLNVYRGNARRVPSVSGRVIPERVFSRAAYEGELLAGLYRDIAPHDPDGILQHEWLNARGCIARFNRGAIEIRVLDIQECPAADLAILAIIIETLRALVGERWINLEALQRFEIDPLFEILTNCIARGERAEITDRDFLAAFGRDKPCTAAELWRHLRNALLPRAGAWDRALDVILNEGTLSTRILRATGPSPDRAVLRRVYSQLADCLHRGDPFLPAGA